MTQETTFRYEERALLALNGYLNSGLHNAEHRMRFTEVLAVPPVHRKKVFETSCTDDINGAAAIPQVGVAVESVNEPCIKLLFRKANRNVQRHASSDDIRQVCNKVRDMRLRKVGCAIHGKGGVR
ncbi:hypothetical protein [Caballeronia glebae]|uniref:hypothetical protein n=1 Tax=Caballeronia glebae TaxID=1777143 RepID=UPI0038B9CFB6